MHLIAQIFNNVAKKYINYYANRFAYDFAYNGEEKLIKKLKIIKKPVVFDIGANVGNYSKLVKLHNPSAIVHAFEISKNNFKKIDKSSIIANNFGLSKENEVIKYKDYGSDSTSPLNTLIVESSFHDEKYSFKIKSAKLRNTDNYLKSKKIEYIDLLKIDTEGSEYKILMSFEKFLEEKKIGIVQFEYGYINAYSKDMMHDFYKFFDKYGYIVARLGDKIKFRTFDELDNNFLSGPNYIAVHNNNRKLIEILSA